MNFILVHPPIRILQDKPIDHKLIPVYDPPQNANETDETFYTKDHPFMHTEECIAAGCPEDLW